MRVSQSRNKMGQFSSSLGVDVQLIGANQLMQAMSILGHKDAKRIAKLAIRTETKKLQRTAQEVVSVDKGKTKEQIQVQIKNTDGGFGFLGRVGVGLRGGGEGPGKRRNVAAIIEFGRRSFTQKIVGRNGTTYRVRIPAVPGQFYLSRAAERHLPTFMADLSKEFDRRVKNRIKRLAKQAGIK